MVSYDRFLSRAGDGMRESAIRRMGSVLAGSADIISFAPGYPAEDTFAWPEFAEIGRELLSGADGNVLQYGPTRGYRPLLDVLVELMASRGIRATADQTILTTGSQQGLDLLARVLCDPGDVVLIELPSYVGAITAFRNVGAALVGVRQDSDGINLQDLADTLARVRREGRRVKALYVVPNFQNPTGLLMSLEKRRHVLAWARQEDLLIIEDDPYRDLFFPDTTTEAETRPISADDDERDGRVVYLSSFSKTLAPGFRVGWASAPAPLASKLEFAKQAEDLCTGSLDQRLIYEACRRGVLARQLPMLRAYYQHKRDVMIGAVERELHGQIRWPAPRGGFFLWAHLQVPVNSETLLTHAQAAGVVFVTGAPFFVDGRGGEHMRLSFSAPTPARIELGVKRLATAISEALAARPHQTAAAAAPARS
jgi:2-aminoadipate transaminase